MTGDTYTQQPTGETADAPITNETPGTQATGEIADAPLDTETPDVQAPTGAAGRRSASRPRSCSSWT